MKPKNDINIIVIDDEKNIRGLIKKILKRNNYKVTTASSAEAGLEILKDKKFQILLLDIDLPGMNGLELLKKLQFSDIIDNTEIIMVSGKGTIESAVKAMKLGAYDFITKPFEVTELRTTVERALEKQDLSYELDIMKSVSRLAQEIGELKPEEELLKDILDLSMKVTGADGASIGIYDEDSERIKIKSARGAGAQDSINKIITLNNKISGWAIRHREPVLLNGSPLNDERDFKDIKPREDINSGLCVPMSMRNKIIGTLNLKIFNRQKNFTEKDLRIITVFAQYAAFTIQNSKDYSKLLQLDKLKDEFIANVSHELRTPLQSITNACEIVKDRYPDEKLFDLIERNSKKMNKLVVELLDTSKLESKDRTLNLKKFNVKNFLTDIKEDLKESAKKKNITIDIESEDNLNLTADRDLINRAIVNLVSNSIKYCPEKSKINIRAHSKNNDIIFKVIDNGPGIPEEDRENIFDKFYQQKPGASLTDKHEGVGLGLSMVKSIVKKHGGKIKLTPTGIEPGAEFIFNIPQKKEH